MINLQDLLCLMVLAAVPKDTQKMCEESSLPYPCFTKVVFY